MMVMLVEGGEATLGYEHSSDEGGLLGGNKNTVRKMTGSILTL
jgi:hypothetical protein